MEQLTLNITDRSKIQIIASSAFNFQIELLEELGKNDLSDILLISKEIPEGFHMGIESLAYQFPMNFERI